MNAEKAEMKALEKIATALTKLDSACAKFDDKVTTFFGKAKQFYEQEKAIHEIKSILKECKTITKIETEAPAKLASDISKNESLRASHMQTIASTIEKLNSDLSKLDDSDDSKIKQFVYQTKSLHDIKKILHHMDLYANYSDNELDDINRLMK